MARYTVTLEKDPENDLARYWIKSPNRPAITAAQYLIDAKLADDPRRFGHHLAEGLWKIEVAPLTAYFEIHEEDKTVKITGIECNP